MISGLSLDNITNHYLFNCKKEMSGKKTILTKSLLQSYKQVLGKAFGCAVEPKTSSKVSISKYIITSGDRKVKGNNENEKFKLEHFFKKTKKDGSRSQLARRCIDETPNSSARKGQKVHNASADCKFRSVSPKIKIKPKSSQSMVSSKKLQSGSYMNMLISESKGRTSKIDEQKSDTQKAFPSQMQSLKNRTVDYIPKFDQFVRQTDALRLTNSTIQSALCTMYPDLSLAEPSGSMPAKRPSSKPASKSKMVSSFKNLNSNSQKKLQVNECQGAKQKQVNDISFESTESFKDMKRTIDTFYSTSFQGNMRRANL
jgi:hypothetical protein